MYKIKCNLLTVHAVTGMVYNSAHDYHMPLQTQRVNDIHSTCFIKTLNFSQQNFANF